jgi:hypothetical protein
MMRDHSAPDVFTTGLPAVDDKLGGGLPAGTAVALTYPTASAGERLAYAQAVTPAHPTVYATTGHDTALIEGDLAAEHDRPHPDHPAAGHPDDSVDVVSLTTPDHNDDTATPDRRQNRRLPRAVSGVEFARVEVLEGGLGGLDGTFAVCRVGLDLPAQHQAVTERDDAVERRLLVHLEEEGAVVVDAVVQFREQALEVLDLREPGQHVSDLVGPVQSRRQDRDPVAVVTLGFLATYLGVVRQDRP